MYCQPSASSSAVWQCCISLAVVFRHCSALLSPACHPLQGKGPAAEAVKTMAIKMRKETPLPAAAAAACRIHRAILLDRDVDPITPMVTQITFEGLIDEVTGIRNGSVAYTPSRREGGGPAGADGGRGRPSSTLLNSADPFYKEFRDLPYYMTSQR